MMETNYKTDKNVAYACKYEVVWCTKYRRRVLHDGIAYDLKQVIKEVAGETGIIIHRLDVVGMYYVLMEMEVPPRMEVHLVVKKMKAVTSRYIRGKYREITTKLPTLWTNAYFVRTVDMASERDIRLFLQQQPTSQRQEETGRRDTVSVKYVGFIRHEDDSRGDFSLSEENFETELLRIVEKYAGYPIGINHEKFIGLCRTLHQRTNEYVGISDYFRYMESEIEIKVIPYPDFKKMAPGLYYDCFFCEHMRGDCYDYFECSCGELGDSHAFSGNVCECASYRDPDLYDFEYGDWRENIDYEEEG